MRQTSNLGLVSFVTPLTCWAGLAVPDSKHTVLVKLPLGSVPLICQAKMFFEDELIALRDQNRAHADALLEDPSASQRDLFTGTIGRDAARR